MYSLRKHILKLRLALLCGIFLTGCTTNYYVDKSRYTTSLANYDNITVYVTNPDNQNYELLKRSKIYALTNNKNAPSKLTLQDAYTRHESCGLGALAAIYTLGMLPYNSPIQKSLSYTLEGNGTSQMYVHKINYQSKTALWQVFFIPFAHSELNTQAKALSLSKRQPCDYKTCGNLKENALNLQ